jgi:hypothetical protein
MKPKSTFSNRNQKKQKNLNQVANQVITKSFFTVSSNLIPPLRIENEPTGTTRDSVFLQKNHKEPKITYIYLETLV